MCINRLLEKSPAFSFSKPLCQTSEVNKLMSATCSSGTGSNQCQLVCVFADSGPPEIQGIDKTERWAGGDIDAKSWQESKRGTWLTRLTPHQGVTFTTHLSSPSRGTVGEWRLCTWTLTLEPCPVTSVPLPHLACECNNWEKPFVFKLWCFMI